MREPDMSSAALYTRQGPCADGVSVLLEVPHGADAPAHLDALRRSVPECDTPWLDALHWCTTDQGAWPLALAIARALCAMPELPLARVIVMRSLLPRAVVDCNRVWTLADARLPHTRVIMSEVWSAACEARLAALHADYIVQADAAYEAVCGAGGWAMQVHTCAPISAPAGAGAEALTQLVAAYASIRRHPRRPDAQLIVGQRGEAPLSDAQLIASLQRLAREAQVRLQVNAPFSMHPTLQLMRYASRHAPRVIGVEVNRARLTSRFEPFKPLALDASRVDAHARLFALGLAERLRVAG